MAERHLAAVPAPRTPRRDHQLEASALASAWTDDAAMATFEAMLTVADFDDHGHAAIVEAMFVLTGSDRPVDTTSIAGELDRMGRLEAIGGEARLGKIAAASGTSRNLEDRCRMLAELSATRRLYGAARAIADAACDVTLTADAAADRAMTALFDATERKGGEPVAIADSIIVATTDSVENTEERIAGVRKGKSTGFVSLDRVIAGRGLRTARVYVIGAPPGTGKSALVLNMMMNFAKRDESVLLFSLEMVKREIADRMLCIEARVSSDRYESGELTAEDTMKLMEAAGRLHPLPIYIDDTKDQTITQIRAKSKRHKRRHGLSLLVVDFLQLVQGREGQDDYQRITGAISGLTKLSDELDVPVIAVASMNRANASRKGKDHRPIASDLLGSSRIESDAALVAFLYRDELYDDTSSDKGVAEFIIRKQRHGAWPRTVRLKFDAECMRFDDLEENLAPPGYTAEQVRDFNEQGEREDPNGF